MTYDQATIEKAARLLCEKRQQLPDSNVWDYKGVAFGRSRLLWKCVADEIREHIDIEEALRRAKESK